MFVPFGIRWGHAKILGLFAGFSALGFILVWFFVPSTNQAATLEDLSYIFGRRLHDHAVAQRQRLWDKTVKGPRIRWRTAPAKSPPRAEVQQPSEVHVLAQLAPPQGDEDPDAIRPIPADEI